MKVLYYVEKELAQFDPARRLRGRCEHLSPALAVMQEFLAKGRWGGVPELGQRLTSRARTGSGAEGTILEKVAPGAAGRAPGSWCEERSQRVPGVHVGCLRGAVSVAGARRRGWKCRMKPASPPPP